MRSTLKYIDFVEQILNTDVIFLCVFSHDFHSVGFLSFPVFNGPDFAKLTFANWFYLLVELVNLPMIFYILKILKIRRSCFSFFHELLSKK